MAGGTFPTSIPSYEDPVSGDKLDGSVGPNHVTASTQQNTDIEQLATKIGTGASPASGAAANAVLVADGSGGTTWDTDTYAGKTDPLNLGFPFTADPNIASTSYFSVGIANRAYLFRVIGGGSVSSIAIDVGTSSGNISLAVYQNSGSGRSSVPGTRLATTGAIACPTAGYNEVSLGGSVDVSPGDWFGISADNTTATFRGVVSTLAASSLGNGRAVFKASAHPLPSTISTPSSGVLHGLILIGVA